MYQALHLVHSDNNMNPGTKCIYVTKPVYICLISLLYNPLIVERVFVFSAMLVNGRFVSTNILDKTKVGANLHVFQALKNVTYNLPPLIKNIFTLGKFLHD
jgi:hypothetical protein